MRTKSILVVDDDDDLRNNLAQALELESYTVFKAANGKQALDQLYKSHSQNLPDLILLDLMMPILDGYGFIEEIQKQPCATFKEIPIIVATAKGKSLDGKYARHTMGELKKPMDLEDLYRVIREAITQRQVISS